MLSCGRGVLDELTEEAFGYPSPGLVKLETRARALLSKLEIK